MNYKEKPNTYRGKIGMLDTKQFSALQRLMSEVDVPERMVMLYNILEREIELEEKQEELNNEETNG